MNKKNCLISGLAVLGLAAILPGVCHADQYSHADVDILGFANIGSTAQAIAYITVSGSSTQMQSWEDGNIPGAGSLSDSGNSYAGITNPTGNTLTFMAGTPQLNFSAFGATYNTSATANSSLSFGGVTATGSGYGRFGSGTNSYADEETVFFPNSLAPGQLSYFTGAWSCFVNPGS